MREHLVQMLLSLLPAQLIRSHSRRGQHQRMHPEELQNHHSPESELSQFESLQFGQLLQLSVMK
jgi:hypothetical protein